MTRFFSPIFFAEHSVSWLLSFLLLSSYGCARVTGPESLRSQTEKEEAVDRSTVGLASFYDNSFHGKPTASGESFSVNELTAAHKTLAFNTHVKVRNLSNNKEVTVRINDRGPFVDGRIIDLSPRAAELLAMKEQGVARVEVTPLRAGLPRQASE